MSIHESALGVCREALSELRQDAVLTMEQLTGVRESASGRKCRMAYEPARIQVLLARAWNFCRRRVRVCSAGGCPGDAWSCTVPDEALRVVAAFDMCGRKLDGWAMYEDRVLRSLEPVSEVEYVVDMQDVDRWPPLVRRAFVKLLARELAIPITGRNSDLQIADKLYKEALREAALADARENKPGREVWGPNVYADAIRGRGGRWHGAMWHGGRFR